MPKPKGSGQGHTELVSLRLDPEADAFYRRQANERGLPLADFLRRTLAAGILTESVSQIKDQLIDIFNEIKSFSFQKYSSFDKEEDNIVSINEKLLEKEVVRSVLLIEALLKKIVSVQNLQALYAAQDEVEMKLKQLWPDPADQQES